MMPESTPHYENCLSCRRKGQKFAYSWTGSGGRRRHVSQRLKRDGYEANMDHPVGLQKLHLMKEYTREFLNSTNATVSTRAPSSLSVVEFRTASRNVQKQSFLSIVKSAPNRFFPTRPTFIIYATVQPETVIIPIVCSIVIFPIVVLASILLLKYYNEKRRAQARFRAGFQYGASTLFTMGKIGATSKAAEKTDIKKSALAVPALNNFLGLPDLEPEIGFEIDHNESMSSSSLQNGDRVKLPSTSNHTTKVPVESKAHLKPAKPPDPSKANVESNPTNCETVVTIEPSASLDFKFSGETEEVIVILEDDELNLMETTL